MLSIPVATILGRNRPYLVGLRCLNALNGRESFDTSTASANSLHVGAAAGCSLASERDRLSLSRICVRWGGSSLLTSEYKLDSASPFSEQERDSSEASPSFSSSAARLLSNDCCGPRLRVTLVV